MCVLNVFVHLGCICLCMYLQVPKSSQTADWIRLAWIIYTVILSAGTEPLQSLTCIQET